MAAASGKTVAASPPVPIIAAADAEPTIMPFVESKLSPISPTPCTPAQSLSLIER